MIVFVSHEILRFDIKQEYDKFILNTKAKWFRNQPHENMLENVHFIYFLSKWSSKNYKTIRQKYCKILLIKIGFGIWTIV